METQPFIVTGGLMISSSIICAAQRTFRRAINMNQVKKATIPSVVTLYTVYIYYP